MILYHLLGGGGSKNGEGGRVRKGNIFFHVVGKGFDNFKVISPIVVPTIDMIILLLFNVEVKQKILCISPADIYRDFQCILII